MVGCKKENISYDMATSVRLSFIDAEGTDLLDPNSGKHYVASDIKVYYLVNGIPTEYYQGNLDSPNGFFISNEMGKNKYVLALLVDNSNKEGKSIFETVTYLKLSQTDTDTVRCEITQDAHSTVCKKVMYNGVLVWQGNTERYVVIEKKL